MHRQPRKGSFISAATLSVLLALFSCSYESDEDEEDRKHKNKITVEALLPQPLMVFPSRCASHHSAHPSG